MSTAVLTQNTAKDQLEILKFKKSSISVLPFLGKNFVLNYFL